MMRVRVKRLDNMNQTEIKACRRLNFGSRGCMRNEFDLSRRTDPERAYAFMIWEDGKLISWAFAFDLISTNPSVYFYTRVSHRRKGYGAKVYRAVIKAFPYAYTYPWDDRSHNFFNKMKGILVAGQVSTTTNR